MSPEIKRLFSTLFCKNMNFYPGVNTAYLHKDGAALAVLVQPVFHAVVCHAEGCLMGWALITFMAVVIKSRLGEVSLILVRDAGVIEGVVNLQGCVLVFAVDVGIVCAEF